MAKVVYCSNCGTRLNIARRALPKYGTIINIVEFHNCPDEPVEFDLTPIDVPTFHMEEGKDKFVQKLNDLAPPPSTIFDKELKDRRYETEEKPQPKSTAPQSVLGIIKGMENTIPAHDLEDIEED